MSALSSAQQSEVKAWEEEILVCEHTLTIQQEPIIDTGQSEPDMVFCVRCSDACRSFQPMRIMQSYFPALAVSHMWACQLREKTVRLR